MPDLPPPDQSRKMEYSSYGEYVRLSNEHRSKDAYSYESAEGETINVPEYVGVDVETCTILELETCHTQSSCRAQNEFLYLVIEMRKGNIPIDLEMAGEAGLHPSTRVKLT